MEKLEEKLHAHTEARTQEKSVSSQIHITQNKRIWFTEEKMMKSGGGRIRGGWEEENYYPSLGGGGGGAIVVIFIKEPTDNKKRE
jgi:hypothetical protein